MVSSIIILQTGDDRSRRERLAPDCEPRGADLVKSAQKHKCQPHSIRCTAPRCISESNSADPQERDHVRPHRTLTGRGIGRDKVRVPHARTPLGMRKRGSRVPADSGWRFFCRLKSHRRNVDVDYARRYSRDESFGLGFDSRHLHLFTERSSIHCLNVLLFVIRISG